MGLVQPPTSEVVIWIYGYHRIVLPGGEQLCKPLQYGTMFCWLNFIGSCLLVTGSHRSRCVKYYDGLFLGMIWKDTSCIDRSAPKFSPHFKGCLHSLLVTSPRSLVKFCLFPNVAVLKRKKQPHFTSFQSLLMFCLKAVDLRRGSWNLGNQEVHQMVCLKTEGLYIVSKIHTCRHTYIYPPGN